MESSSCGIWASRAQRNMVSVPPANDMLLSVLSTHTDYASIERRVRQHVRSIHKIAYSNVLRDYCITGSADGEIRVWVSLRNRSFLHILVLIWTAQDLRHLTDCVMKIRHPAAVRSVVLSPVQWQPRHVITGLDNGNIYRYVSNLRSYRWLSSLSKLAGTFTWVNVVNWIGFHWHIPARFLL